MTNTGARIGNKKNRHGKVGMHSLKSPAIAALAVMTAVLSGCGSDGSDDVNVPNVVGDAQTAASTAITGAGLTVGTVTTQSSSSVASGDVISENPAASTSVAKSSAVALVISSGPAQVSVPSVVGDTQAAAATAITGAGLTVGTVTKQSSSSVASGDVISESPAAKINVTKGSAVALVVSTGPVTYTIGGTLIGLAPSATVHVLNGSDSDAISANGPFTLPTGVVGGGKYGVTVGTPTSTQTCAVQNASGSIASANITNVLVYCTYNVSAATVKATYTSVGVVLDNVVSGVNYPFDYVGTDIFDGVSAISSTYTINYAGTIVPGQTGTSTYAVTTANAVPSYTDSTPGLGGIEGANGDAIVAAEGMVSGTQPSIYVAVLPNISATTDSVNGNYTQVSLVAKPSTGTAASQLTNLTLTNGSASGTTTTNTDGTISTSTGSSQFTFTITGGLLTIQGGGSGAVSADDDLFVAADITSGDAPEIFVAVPQASAATQATFQGVYSATQYGGDGTTEPFAKAITLLAYGNGTWSITFTKNAQGTITTDNTGSGTYTVATNGTLVLTDSDGNVYNGAISADGNAVVFANITSGETPAISVGVRQ